ncbi:MAG TPA: prepilin-type N-terminal cleavage/methylation domain-containing protein [Sedimentisphaerales bacterium]|nr:prepilin-type N-terminal cleavage/methylation domain-containing protein [Sedimentisphaerales bacterium]HRV47364.1 prepilin-type N-terminal cleavage/methylation domain-containing protein [Sedimentisphaerales bacterium]
MPTCSARIADRPGAGSDSPASRGPAGGVRRSAEPPRAGFTLVELIVVLSILAMFVLMAQVNLFGTLRRSTFKSQVQSFVSAMQMAASTAAQTGRRYEVIVDVTEQTYLLRQISASNLAEVLDEEIIVDGQFGDSCRVSYVEFDDGTYANEGQAKFRVGHAGWQYGGKVVFLDDGEQPHTVAVGRLVPIVQVLEGDAELMRPKAKDEVSSF